MNASGDQCASCGAGLAPDQRYCLQCGTRRGDPRLPFMDAVVFMDAIKAPQGNPAPPPAEKPEARSGWTANATLVAGIATLILAIGVGVIIGRSGDSGTQTAAAPAPQIIKVGGGGGEEEESTAKSKSAKTASKAKKSKDKGAAKKAKAPEPEVDSSGTSEAAAEVLKPSGDVKLPPPTVQPGGECEKGTAGCSEGGEFDGEFFGE